MPERTVLSENKHSMALPISLVWVALAVMSVFGHVRVSCASVENKLYKTLFADYDPLTRPVTEGSDVVMVNMSVSLVQLLSVDDKEQVISVNVWVYQMWYDYRLTWNPHDYGNISYILVAAQSIWYPDTSLYISADEASSDHPYIIVNYFRLRVESDGRVFVQSPCNWNIPCNMDVSGFPNDNQHCTVSVGMWSHTARQVDYQPIFEEVKKELFIPSNSWSIAETTVEKSYSYDIYGGGPYAFIDYSLHLQRKPLFYLLNLCIPSVLLSFLSALIFYFPPDSVDKIPHGLSVLLTIFIFDMVVIEIMPPSSDSIPAPTMYLFTNMITTAISITIAAGIIDMNRWKGDFTGWKRGLLLWVASVLRVSVELVKLKRRINRTARQSKGVRIKNYRGTHNVPTYHFNRTSHNGTDGPRIYDIKAVMTELEKIDTKLDEFINGEKETKIDSDWKLLAFVLNKICLMVVLIINITTSAWMFLAGISIE
ncbi:neuronal acetylcholine receptor subunit beta-3-like [Ptychodera flava]|uniref:neuronal acetylcholine receptor subunit beta-3-like n=1 Tax=Ptychodera flava TaxID=63121 RepID=UPI00396A9EB2